jgi:Ser/Thr protein kinase RdoA (MazF antagonist)
MHAASQRLVLPGPRRRMQWDQDDVTSHDFLPPEDQDIAQRLAQMVQEVRLLPTPPERFGLIHGDLHQGNFFSNEQGELAVFDFDDACYHWYAYDLAVVFYHLPEGDAEVPPLPSRTSIMRHLLAGYRQVREIPPEYPQQVQRFLLLREMQMYQSLFKKTLPADRQPWWFSSAQRLAGRIRSGRPLMEIPW